MARPYASKSIDQLESDFHRAKSTHDTKLMKVLEAELGYRKMPSARELAKSVAEQLGLTSTGPQEIENARPADVRNASSTSSGKKPTDEQRHAIECFLQGGSLKINAYAGTGKTSTLQILASSSGMRGEYIAFNRDIVRDAKEKFPDTVDRSTTHGLAFRPSPLAIAVNLTK